MKEHEITKFLVYFFFYSGIDFQKVYDIYLEYNELLILEKGNKEIDSEKIKELEKRTNFLDGWVNTYEETLCSFDEFLFS